MKKTLALLFVSYFLLALSPHAAANPFTPEEIFSDMVIDRFIISPDGKYIAYNMPQENTDIVTVAELATMKETFTFSMGDRRFVGSFRWANNKRILLQPAKRLGVNQTLYNISQMQGFNFDGSKNVKLYGYQTKSRGGKDKGLSDYFYIENSLRNDPEHIMIVTYESSAATKRLRKLNIYNGRVGPGVRSQVRKASFVTDENGEAIAQWGNSADDTNIFIYKDQNGDWINMENADDYHYAYPYKGNSLLLKHDAGDNTYEYVQFDRFTKKSTVLVSMKDAQVYPIRNKNKEMIGYRTSEDGKTKRFFFDEQSAEAQFQHLIGKTFPAYSTNISWPTDDFSKRIIRISSDVEPGKQYLYDATKKTKLRLINKRRKGIKRNRFAKMTPIKFEARDGLLIHGYLSKPNGSKGNDPMVVMVHGGPFGVRDSWGYDSEVQFLTSQGYAVLQVNFRGSGGYGEDFEEAGHKQWGLAMQDDVTDGTQWAIKNGFADKNRICIYGASYGGYAALMGAVKEPDLYKCTVGYVGVYDLPLDSKEGDINDSSEGRAFTAKTVGNDISTLMASSPVHQAAKIKAAVMLIHGKLDERVPFEHYENMTEALDKVGHSYVSLVKKDEGHGFEKNKNQYELYTKLAKFLKKHLK